MEKKMDIYDEFDKLNKNQTRNVLMEALDYMNQYNGRSTLDCIAMAMGWDAVDEKNDGNISFVFVEGRSVAPLPENNPESTTVYAAMKNSDTVEGLGPMVVDELFTSKENADNYIDQQLGIMGRKSEICGNKKPWSQQEHGDWQVEPMTLNTGLLTNEQKHKNKVHKSALNKLDKLTDDERAALVNAKVLNA
jgi:hypothetical protein